MGPASRSAILGTGQKDAAQAQAERNLNEAVAGGMPEEIEGNPTIGLVLCPDRSRD